MEMKYSILFLPMLLYAQDEDNLERYVSSEIRRLRIEATHLKQENQELRNKIEALKEKLDDCEDKNTKASEYITLGTAILGSITGSICAYKGIH